MTQLGVYLQPKTSRRYSFPQRRPDARRSRSITGRFSRDFFSTRPATSATCAPAAAAAAVAAGRLARSRSNAQRSVGPRFCCAALVTAGTANGARTNSTTAATDGGSHESVAALRGDTGHVSRSRVRLRAGGLRDDAAGAGFTAHWVSTRVTDNMHIRTLNVVVK